MNGIRYLACPLWPPNFGVSIPFQPVAHQTLKTRVRSWLLRVASPHHQFRIVGFAVLLGEFELRRPDVRNH